MIAIFLIAAMAGAQVQDRAESGVKVRFEIAPAEKGGAVTEGKPAAVRFHVSDASGSPLTGLRPAVWMDVRQGKKAEGKKECEKEIESYLQPSMGAQPLVDLSSWYVLVLNEEPSISVLDPIRGFGSSKLLTLVMLDAPGSDWVKSRDQDRVFVSEPSIGKVAVISTGTWKVEKSIDAGKRPTRLALQPDGHYLWADAGDGSVTVIDTARLTRAARIETGPGPHQMAFSRDDRFAFVANRGAGGVSVIDVRTLKKVRDLQTAAEPIALAYSKLGDVVYAAHQGGQVVSIDPRRHTVTGRFESSAGLTGLELTPDGRWGFAINRGKGKLHIFDASAGRLAYTVDMGKSPDQVSFTDGNAFVRSLESEDVIFISLDQLDKGKAPTLSEFPSGQLAPGLAHGESPAAIVPTPETGSVLIANPADKLVYYYTEGMGAPMGSFSNYGRVPRAVLVADRGLREVKPGTYGATVQMPASGTLGVSLFVDTPRIAQCFSAAVASSGKSRKAAKYVVRPVFSRRKFALGSPMELKFRISGPPQKGAPPDLEVMAMLAPGIWRDAHHATRNPDDTYSITVHPPRKGLYYVHWQSQALGIRYQESQPLILEVSSEENNHAQR
ncbi:MAG TPA: cytochrome D1 domain-containing protein [Myxococcales bacterium]|nr:cytochrome D1 domain-containing protein [Myxococcales bacterium]